jgi:cell division inhibitor SepF
VSNILGKLKDFVGLSDPADYEYDYDEMEGEDYQRIYETDHAQASPEAEPQPSRFRSQTGLGSTAMNSSTNNVVGMPGAGKWWGAVAEVIVIEPRAFEEMPQVIQALRERKSVVLNLTMMDPEQAQRSVDFIAGATYTIDGHQERIGESIFLFTPSCVQVSTQLGVTQETPQAQPAPTRPMTAWASGAATNLIAQ